jgi:hypothetical protein
VLYQVSALRQKPVAASVRPQATARVAAAEADEALGQQSQQLYSVHKLTPRVLLQQTLRWPGMLYSTGTNTSRRKTSQAAHTGDTPPPNAAHNQPASQLDEMEQLIAEQLFPTDLVHEPVLLAECDAGVLCGAGGREGRCLQVHTS